MWSSNNGCDCLWIIVLILLIFCCCGNNSNCCHHEHYPHRGHDCDCD